MAEIDRLFQYLVSSGGSDLHLAQGQPPKVRVHGAVTPIEGEPVLEGEMIMKLLGEICEPIAFKKKKRISFNG